MFQRTPSAINRRDNRPTDADWAASLQSGWQRERMANFTAVVSGDPFDVDLVKDGWTEMIGEVLLAAKREYEAGRKTQSPAVLMQRADDASMDKVRRRVDEEIEDAATAEALKPWYGAFCKRGCFHDEFLATFNRPNVRLIDTQGAGVEEITETGVVVAGKAYPLDCLIFATGFAIEGADPGNQGYEVYGRDGLALSAKRRSKWRTLHGYMTRDFPNYLMMSYAQTGQSPNFHHILDEQSRHLAYILSRAQSAGAITLEPEEEAENAWAEEVVRAAKGRTAYLKECTPGYYNAEGAINEHTVLNGPYWKSPTRFFGMTKAWREEDALAGLEINRPSSAA